MSFSILGRKLTADEVLLLRTVLETLLKVIGSLPSLQFELSCLKRPTTVRLACARYGLCCIRSSLRIKQNVPVLQILCIWSVLEMLLKGVLSFDR